MASMRDIKLKIKSVKSTQQITKAMNLVSAAKLQRAKGKLDVNRPYFDATLSVLREIVRENSGLTHMYFKKRPVKKSTTIIIAADRGLCGGYNVNVCKMARKFNRRNANHEYIAVGTRGRDFFRRRRKSIILERQGITEDPTYTDAAELAAFALDMYERGVTDEVWLAYTKFKSIISHQPTMFRLLPVDSSELLSSEIFAEPRVDAVQTAEAELAEKSKPPRAMMNFSPSEDELISYIVPKYVDNVLYGALLESAACQEGARMTAMDSATDNAQDMIDKYTVSYNRARQGAITQELTEIVSGANALE